MDHLTISTALTVVPAQPAPVERMPSIVNDNLLLDMGRMTPGWLLEEKTLFLQAAMGVPDAGRWSGHWSNHASLMVSSPMPGSGTC